MRVAGRNCITFCMTKEGFVLQYVKQMKKYWCDGAMPYGTDWKTGKVWAILRE